MRSCATSTPTRRSTGYATTPQSSATSTVGERVIAKSFAAFGLIALALAGAGLYGVMAFAVAQRTREIGVRRALGAPTRHVLGDVFGRSFVELGVGLAIGVVAGIALARLLTHSLPNIEAVGVAAIGAALGVLIVAVALAVSVPVRRALVSIRPLR